MCINHHTDFPDAISQGQIQHVVLQHNMMFCHSGFLIHTNSYLLEHVLILDEMLDDKFTVATGKHTHLIFWRKQYMYLILWYASVSL